MNRSEQIEKELATAELASREGNEGKARVCTRRAVGLAVQDWLERFPENGWRGDALYHLRQIQQHQIFPLPIRQAAMRLRTKITQRDRAPFTSDPISDARLIIDHLMSKYPPIPEVIETMKSVGNNVETETPRATGKVADAIKKAVKSNKDKEKD